MPSSRSGSNSIVEMYAGGRPATSVAPRGAAYGETSSEPWASPRYHSQLCSAGGRAHIGVSWNCCMLGVSSRSSSSGMPRYWKQIAGPPRSRAEQREAGGETAAGAAAVDRDPRGIDAQHVGVVVQPHRARRSSPRARAGNGCSGARRYSTDTTTTPSSCGQARGATVLRVDAAEEEAAAVDVEALRAIASWPAPSASTPARSRRDRPAGPEPRDRRCRGRTRRGPLTVIANIATIMLPRLDRIGRRAASPRAPRARPPPGRTCRPV